VAFFEAALCFFAPQHTGSVFAFACAPKRGAPIPNAHTVLAAAIAAHCCRNFLVLISLSCARLHAKV